MATLRVLIVFHPPTDNPRCFSFGRRWCGGSRSTRARQTTLLHLHQRTTQLRIMLPLQTTQARDFSPPRLHCHRTSALQRLDSSRLRLRVRAGWETLLPWAWVCQTRATYLPPTSPMLRRPAKPHRSQKLRAIRLITPLEQQHNRTRAASKCRRLRQKKSCTELAPQTSA
jgi:hypothetical protein